MYKFFNKNTINCNYSCCKNIGSNIVSLSRIVTQPNSYNHGYKWMNKAACLFDNKCLTTNIVYEAVVSTTGESDKNFFGIAETLYYI